MVFIYDEKNEFENFVNINCLAISETDYWKNFLKKIIRFLKETNSKKGRKILNNYEKEIKNLYKYAQLKC